LNALPDAEADHLPGGKLDQASPVVGKVEWQPGELCPRVGFIVTNMSRPPERVVAFYNKRGTAEQCAISSWVVVQIRRYPHRSWLLCQHLQFLARSSVSRSPYA
jgi:hypothetical protein